jgi:pteridine reductase
LPDAPENPDRFLASRTVLVTGGATRVGAAIGRTLHAAGAHLAIHYRRSAGHAGALQAELEALRPGSVTLVQADLLDTAALPILIDQVVAASGRLDVLVNNASSFYPTPVGEATPEHWTDLMGTNAQAPFFLAQAAAPQLKANHGCIVNLVDIHAERPHKRHTIYSMAKAANAMLVKSLARELAPEVRVNGVAPGAILWPENFFEDEDRLAVLARIPLGRPGTPQDIADTVAFLVRADYMTGQILAVDGGRSVQQ